ncbi:MAG: hypothetical protein A3K19_15155 [Lentisphaerae bacterium RIFOXYB12_FULL_65_16]|nr:MAG: hypothetical protein A3K18_16655 [Lentisphaerae bacterium RIFOXYA12_64_32]OGV88430.1 MAG: hypothetical protein A3K19_15155 [Lentisphaerae bacterium RIFOXYB12_FULL_65_16]
MPHADEPVACRPVDELSHHFPPGMQWRFALAYGALFLPFAVVTPYLQVLLRCRGYDREQIGLVQGCLEVMAVLAPPLWGYMADRTGRPRLMLGLAALAALPSFLLFGCTRSVVGALFVATLFGLFYKPLIPLTDGLAFRFIRHHGGDYGAVRAGGSVSFLVCIAILEMAGIAATVTGNMILVAMAMVALLHLGSVLLLPSDKTLVADARAATEPAAHPGVRVFLTRGFILVTLCAFLGRVAMMSYYGFFTLFLKEEIGFSKAGYIWVLGPLSEIPVIFYSKRIMERIGVRNLFALGLLGCVVRLFTFGITRNIWVVVLLQSLHALTFGAFHCATVTYVSRCVPARLNSTAQSVFAAVAMGGGGIVGGVLGGWVAERYGFTALYLSFSGIALLGLVLLLALVPTLGGERPRG